MAQDRNPLSPAAGGGRPNAKEVKMGEMCNHTTKIWRQAGGQKRNNREADAEYKHKLWEIGAWRVDVSCNNNKIHASKALCSKPEQVYFYTLFFQLSTVKHTFCSVRLGSHHHFCTVSSNSHRRMCYVPGDRPGDDTVTVKVTRKKETKRPLWRTVKSAVISLQC